MHLLWGCDSRCVACRHNRRRARHTRFM
jgi:hypothetical protein